MLWSSEKHEFTVVLKIFALGFPMWGCGIWIILKTWIANLEQEKVRIANNNNSNEDLTGKVLTS